MASPVEDKPPITGSPSSVPTVVAGPNGARRDAGGSRLYVKVDMEGISGIVSPEQVEPGSTEYEASRRLLMHDLGAVLDGAFGVGCTEAVIYDAHRAGRNVDLNLLDRRASVISGRPPPSDDFFYGLDESYTALFLVGYHARAGAPDALLPGTFDPDIASLAVNGTVLGEVGLEAALAGRFGVPLAFVSSDSAGVLEARELLGDEVEAVEVKQAISGESGLCFAAAHTARLLREGASQALRRAPGLPPVIFESPTALDVKFTSRKSADALDGMPGISRISSAVVRAQGADVAAAWRDFVTARNSTTPQPQPQPSVPDRLLQRGLVDSIVARGEEHEADKV